MNIPMISIINPMHAATDTMIVTAVAETRQTVKSQLDWATNSLTYFKTRNRGKAQRVDRWGDTVIMEGWQEFVCALSIGAISNDLEWPSYPKLLCFLHFLSPSVTGADRDFIVMGCLPRDAMLARYMLSLCVRLSVRPSVGHTPV